MRAGGVFSSILCADASPYIAVATPPRSERRAGVVSFFMATPRRHVTAAIDGAAVAASTASTRRQHRRHHRRQRRSCNRDIDDIDGAAAAASPGLRRQSCSGSIDATAATELHRQHRRHRRDGAAAATSTRWQRRGSIDGSDTGCIHDSDGSDVGCTHGSERGCRGGGGSSGGSASDGSSGRGFALATTRIVCTYIMNIIINIFYFH
jgi:hypothetical protein